MSELRTKRLKLIPLTLAQLQLYLVSPRQLENDLGYPIAEGNFNDTVTRAINIKLSKMAQADERDHPWYTYWLIVVTAQACGAGLVGFKGYPNEQGEVEIGYGIDPVFRNKGYTTEAVRALIAWAFAHENCLSVVADTQKSNVASARVLEKTGMHVYGETEGALLWRIENRINR